MEPVGQSVDAGAATESKLALTSADAFDTHQVGWAGVGAGTAVPSVRVQVHAFFPALNHWERAGLRFALSPGADPRGAASVSAAAAVQWIPAQLNARVTAHVVSHRADARPVLTRRQQGAAAEAGAAFHQIVIIRR